MKSIQILCATWGGGEMVQKCDQDHDRCECPDGWDTDHVSPGIVPYKLKVGHTLEVFHILCNYYVEKFKVEIESWHPHLSSFLEALFLSAFINKNLIIDKIFNFLSNLVHNLLLGQSFLFCKRCWLILCISMEWYSSKSLLSMLISHFLVTKST